MHRCGKADDIDAHIIALLRKKYDDFADVFSKPAKRTGRRGLTKTAGAFEQFGEVAKNHYDRVSKAVSSEQGEEMTHYLCPVCGYMSAKFAPAHCPVCGAIEARDVAA